eukprot:TRINITY_DN8385_c0_g1_i4.p1 TRINITY_DN8385_c0_g1~~TRINITY_DN8385_c0_g1_i4.p1  ORF type:complete len:504 (+),score=106.38 TRINITY_DN8385_c0_g1_i4:3-1514(+)
MSALRINSVVRRLMPFGKINASRYSSSLRLSVCQGCGAPFQHHTEHALGFISAEALEKRLAGIGKYHNRTDGLAWSNDVSLPSDDVNAIPTLDHDLRLLNVDDGVTADDHFLGNASKPRARKATALICQRCYKLDHYGEVAQAHDTFAASVAQLHATLGNPLYVLVVDVTDFPAGLAPTLVEACHGKAILLVNKMDLLHKRVKGTSHANVFKASISKIARHHGLDVEQVLLTSTKSGYGLDSTFKRLHTLSQEQGRSVVLLGASNAGKSSLLNTVLASKQNSTVSATAGTTQGLMVYEFDRLYGGDPVARPASIAQLPSSVDRLIEEGAVDYLIDTPGYLNRQQLFTHVPVQASKDLLSQRLEQPRFMHVKPGQSIILGCFGHVDSLEGTDPFRIAFSMPGTVTLHRTKTARVESLLLDKHAEDWLSPPATRDDLATSEMETHVFDFTASQAERVFELTIGGLGRCLIIPQGWNKVAKLGITLPKGVAVVQTPLIDQFMRKKL